MPSSDRKPLDAGDWFPWRMFVAAAGAACQPAALLLAVAGLMVSELGFAALMRVASLDSTALALPVADGLSLEPVDLFEGSRLGQRGYFVGFARPSTGLQAGWFGAVAGFWPVAVWTVFGAAIARLAALRLTRRGELGIRAAVLWSAATAAARIGLVAGLLGVMAVLCGVVWLLGRASTAPVVGGGVDLLMPITLLISAAAALVGLGLAIGWPLMTAGAGVERPDPFDTVSRGLAYAYQRPLRLIAYVGQAWLVGVVAGAAVQLLVRSMLRVAWLAVGSRPEELTGVAGFWWAEAMRLPLVYHAAYFWCTVTAIYLLLRRDIDEQQTDEVFLEETTAAQPAE